MRRAIPNAEVVSEWSRSDDELEKSFGKRTYGGVAYNNCSQLLYDFYEMLYAKKNVRHGNKLFVNVDPVSCQTTLDPETLEETLTFSGAFHEEKKSSGEVIFKVAESEDRKLFLRHRKPYVTAIRMAKDKISRKDKGYECWYDLSMCDGYKESFKRRTGNATCPVKWFYEHHFNFSRPSHPEACVVDRALNGRPIEKWELESFHNLPVIMSPTSGHCSSFTPMLMDTGDMREFAFQRQNFEYLIMLDSLNQKKPIVLYGF